MKEIMLKFFTMALILSAFFNISGCATLKLDEVLEHPTSEPYGELRNNVSSTIQTKYCGEIIFQNHQYWHYIIKRVCNENKPVDLLIPINSNNENKSLITESSMIPANPCTIVNLNYSGAIPTHYLVNMVEKEWKGYPSKITLTLNETENGFYIIYQSDHDKTPSKYDVVGLSDLEWVCRSKSNFVTKIMLTPFTSIFDAATVPIQIIYYIFFFDYKP